MATEVKVPTLGESITEATLGEWLKKPGDPVTADAPIASLETDMVAGEGPSPVAGVMGEQLVKVGDTAAVGAAIARIDAGSGAAAQPQAAQAQTASAPPASTPVNPAGPGENIEIDEAEHDGEDEGSHLTLSPAVRSLSPWRRRGRRHWSGAHPCRCP